MAPEFGFEIDPYRRRALLLGLDEIGSILADDADDIARFEARQRVESPWLQLDDVPGSIGSFPRTRSTPDE